MTQHPMQKRRAELKQEGREAYARLEDYNENPYVEHSWKWHEWKRGWIQARVATFEAAHF